MLRRETTPSPTERREGGRGGWDAGRATGGGIRRGGAPVAAVLTWGLGAVLLLAPGSAHALCPNCLGQRADFGTTQALLGLFLVVPFVAAYVVWRVIRRAAPADGPSGPAPLHDPPGVSATAETNRSG